MTDMQRLPKDIRFGEPLSTPILMSPLTPLYPSTASKLVLWQTYIDVVDPTLKLFHIPTAQREFVKAIQDPSTIEPAMECLMFAVYYSFIATMPVSACLSTFSEDKAVLIRRYRLGVETALLKSKFLHSSDVKVLQALTFVRNSDDQPDMQALMSIAIGNAMRMGLNCERAMLDLSAFETEMCRRLWWQVYILDVRTSMECGAEPSIREQTISMKKPRNVNDIALHPDMTVLPDSQDEKTEMTLILVRIQGSKITRRTIFSESFNRTNGYSTLTREGKCQKLDEFKETAEMKYLIRNSSQIPLDVIASATAKLIVAKLKVMFCQPQTTEASGSSLRDTYKVLCLDVLKESHKVRCYKLGRPWSWLFEACVEWDALTYVLLDLCVTPRSGSSEDAYHVVDQVCTEWQRDPDLVGDTRWQLIEALWLEVKSARRMNSMV
ncbi:fungal specific transcription factor [Fusarium austroafricanum]|uniref:Fungal specific transcription factor n=1 Tax=Fusarium austroafricanum TaxID=2364996 RepID=A0A8H4NP80_9HYPO|nr:fungal specific transcription factor [Fusarium austroafricanum]